MASQEFIDPRDPGFYSKGINELPLKCQMCIYNMGVFIEKKIEFNYVHFFAPFLTFVK